MSEIMRPIAFPDLLRWIQEEYRQGGSVFGIRKEKFYKNTSGKGLSLFGTNIDSPLGPAAGPHTQLAQNILSACLAGSRFVELKTVQIMDGEELRKAVRRPCINAMDEGYNVEWSTELTVQEAFAEYVKAWFLCHVFAGEFDLTPEGGFIFNMSVGYSLEGIKSEKIDTYIEGMKNAANTAVWRDCYRYLADNIGSFHRFTLRDLEGIPSAVSPGITLSTLHGCPREEIEGIAAYLITEKGLHTYIKCNPTLLGYENARSILDEMGYTYVSFDELHFREDLQFNDAVDMLGRLRALAAERNLAFGVKLTNTFPVDIKRGELPGTEMYMSGRSLFPLSVRVAERLSRAFDGQLPISYSGGVDFFNLAAILETGIRPVTAATTLLKPGGYERLRQLAELAEGCTGESRRGAGSGPIRVEALAGLAGKIPAMNRYQKEYRSGGSRKTESPLPLFNCAKAPCMDGGCPIHQRIPGYLERAAAGDYGEAFRIIAADNTAPSITGTICDHQCQSKCTRLDYEDPLEIRAVKKIVCDHAQKAYLDSLRPAPLRTEASAAVIGAGPAGIAAAVFLRRNGVPVRVYEKRDKPYGMVRYVIPAFRIDEEAIDRDFELAVRLGVEFCFGVPEEYSLEALKKEHSFVILATGAWKEGASPVKSGGENVLDALKFLEDTKKSPPDLGKTVGVIGGGDVAMDCARAAKRAPGVERVTIVYRRTREFMPAQREELELALADGVELVELRAPESYNRGTLVCEVMTLGDYDTSGRRGITGTGRKEELSFDTLIGAVGAGVDTALFGKNGIALNGRGFPLLKDANESSLPGVYIAGDCKAGPATVVKAIADGKIAAADILKKLGLPSDIGTPIPQEHNPPGCYAKKGVLCEGEKSAGDGFRCLSCNGICEICCDVCPNRANIVVSPEPSLLTGTDHQVVHIDAMCNECGNCAVFCPHGGLPYRDKLTVFSREEDFNDSRNRGFLRLGSDTFKVRLEDGSVHTWRRGDPAVPPDFAALIGLVADKYAYVITTTRE
ncbi:MAG: putative selenate reductase subunit YgfK [Spirochaetaceae bacterium]|jgi:putative selenate reductase|nr:putative selenate reductase subunit YgfK [Spirochaetaceae bacterium]